MNILYEDHWDVYHEDGSEWTMGDISDWVKQHPETELDSRDIRGFLLGMDFEVFIYDEFNTIYEVREEDGFYLKFNAKGLLNLLINAIQKRFNNR